MSSHSRVVRRLLSVAVVPLAWLVITSVSPAQAPEKSSSRQAQRAFYAKLAKAIKAGQTAETKMAGMGDHPFTNVWKRGGYLIGLNISYGAFAGSKLIIRSVQPIYQTLDGRKYGTIWGVPSLATARVVAKPGYAVAAMSVYSGLDVDGLQLTFMKRRGEGLDPDDSYKSIWYGSKGLGKPRVLGGDGRLVLGIFGRTSGLQLTRIELRGLGLVLLDQK